MGAPQKESAIEGVRREGDEKGIAKQIDTIRSLQIDGLWVYYFHQETFLFVLAADGGLEVAALPFSDRRGCRIIFAF